MTIFPLLPFSFREWVLTSIKIVTGLLSETGLSWGMFGCRRVPGPQVELVWVFAVLL